MKRLVCGVVLSVFLTFGFNFSINASTWVVKDNPKQTIFLKNNKWFDAVKAEYVKVLVDDEHAGRSERVRWGSLAKKSATAYINIQKGKPFRYYSTLDEFDSSPLKKHAEAKKISAIQTVNVTIGEIDFFDISTYYKGLSRNCKYFNLKRHSDQDTRIMTGHFCPAVGTALTKADVLKFLDSIYESQIGPLEASSEPIKKSVTKSIKNKSYDGGRAQSKAERLKEAKDLFKQDIITKGEYEQLRKKILGLD